MKAFIFLYKVSALADNSNIELPLNELDRPLLVNGGSLVTKNGKQKNSQIDLMEMNIIVNLWVSRLKQQLSLLLYKEENK